MEHWRSDQVIKPAVSLGMQPTTVSKDWEEHGLAGHLPEVLAHYIQKLCCCVSGSLVYRDFFFQIFIKS